MAQLNSAGGCQGTATFKAGVSRTSGSYIGENIHLEAEALGFGTVAIGAFSEDRVSQVLGIKKGIPVYLMPFGKKR